MVPACNERWALPGCLRAVVTAALCAPVPVTVVVVLDASDDGSADLAGGFGPDVHFVSIEARNVGAARQAGFRYVRTMRECATACWYATTDADTRVDSDWLVRQLNTPADMVLGLLEYPIWMWHWALPADPAVPWYRLHAMPSSRAAIDRKRHAVQCFRSQIESRAPGVAPVLPAFVVHRLLGVGEVVFR